MCGPIMLEHPFTQGVSWCKFNLTIDMMDLIQRSHKTRENSCLLHNDLTQSRDSHGVTRKQHSVDDSRGGNQNKRQRKLLMRS